MKRRILKKQVNYIAGELFAECVVLSEVVPGIDNKKVDELMARVLYMQDEFISRINHTQPGNVKGFYKAFYTDFQAQVDAIIDEIGKLH
jgi:hypothetical protein